MATQNIMAVTSSKQWIHFFLSDLWPPTSNNLENDFIEKALIFPLCAYLKLRFLNEKWTSTIPVVLTLVLRMSCSVGWYSLAPRRSKSSKKLENENKFQSHCSKLNQVWVIKARSRQGRLTFYGLNICVFPN